MTKPLKMWLSEMSSRFSSDFDAFDVYAFEGTEADLSSELARWQHPPGVSVSDLDIASATDTAANSEEARRLVQSELRRIGDRTGRTIVTVKGLHVLAHLYPGGLLQPIHQWLRRGSSGVVLIMPPAPRTTASERAQIADWRAAVRTAIGSDNVVIRGGN